MEPPRSLSMEKKHWWTMNRKIINKHIREARSLIATQDLNAVSSAIGILDLALTISPKLETALELKAKSLLFLRRFREVAEMLQDYIPSYQVYSATAEEDSSTSLSAFGSSRAVLDSREGAKLLPKGEDGDRSSRCFSIYDIKRKVIAGIHRACDREGQWRYIILGQACCHLGLLEDAMILLQTSGRLAATASRRQSTSLSDDTFSLSAATATTSPPHLLTHIKLLLRRRAAATSALDAGHPHEAARHFSKILESRRHLTPHHFAATCLIGRAGAHRAAGKFTDAIADCNRALALDPTSIPALRSRADLLESVRCLADCLRDLDNLKLLYDAIIRSRKPRFHGEVRYRDAASSLRALSARMNSVRQRLEGNEADYHKLIGVRRGCSRSELERANVVLLMRHRPEKAGAFLEKMEFCDESLDVEGVREQARMSALMLYRMLQKGYCWVMRRIMEEERKGQVAVGGEKQGQVPVYQGVFCRDMAEVGGMLSRVMAVKYEGLTC